MSIKEYTYGELLAEIKDEFGFEGTSKDSFVGARLNRALQLIKRKRPTWHFMIRPITYDVLGKVTGTGDFTEGSNQVTNVVWTTSHHTLLRHMLYPGDWTGRLTKGSMVTDVTGTTITLDAAYLGTTEVGKSFTSTVGYFPVPDDFAKMQLVYNVEDPRRRYKYIPLYRFEQLRLQETPVGGITPIYTVMPDPLPSYKGQSGTDKLGRTYIAIYPFLTETTTLRGLYFFSFQNLDTTSDISFLPQEARTIIIYATCWEICTSIGDSRLDEFKQRTVAEVEELASDDSFSADDPDGWVPGMFLESDGVDGPDGPGRMPSFNAWGADDWWFNG